MLSRKMIAALLLGTTMLLAGCQGAKETDEVGYILVIGVDKAPGGRQKVTYQTALPAGKSAEGGDKEKSAKGEGYILNTLELPTPADGRMMLNATMSRFHNVSHVSAFIFSEEVARDGLGPSLAHIVRNRDYRESIFLFICRGSAEEYIKNNRPTLEQTISKYYESTMLSASEGSYYLPTDIHQFYSRLKNPGGSPVAVYTGINPMTGQNIVAGAKTPQQTGDPHLPGGIPRSGTEDPIDFAGLALFKNDKMVGVLNSDETRAVAILNGRFTRGLIGMVDPLKPGKDYVTLLIRLETKPKITATLTNSAPYYTVHAHLECEIQNITSGINYEAPEYRELLENQLAELLKQQMVIMLAHTRELGSDPVGFGLYLRPLFANTDELANADMAALYQAAAFDLTVTARIRRTGLAWRTTPVLE